MIRFKYTPNDGIQTLISQTITEYSMGSIYGMLEEGSKYQLKNLGLYLVCSTTEVEGVRRYSDPTAVVARNDYDAVRIFAGDTDKPGSVMCVLEDKASNAKVEPI